MSCCDGVRASGSATRGRGALTRSPAPPDGGHRDRGGAVPPAAKGRARPQLGAALKPGGYGGRELIVRGNGLESPWGYDDIVAAAGFGADAILLPKVASAGAVHQAETIMEASGAPQALSIWCMMETPLGMLHAEEIAEASRRVGALVMGTSDLAKDLYAAHTRDRLPMITALGLCMLAARAAGVAILDGVHLDLADDEGFAYSCRQGKELGFDGKTLIHPKTIDVANEVFGPSAEEVEWSRTIIAAHAEAEKEGKGIVVVDGKLIENLHVLNAERVVAMDEAIRDMESVAG